MAVSTRVVDHGMVNGNAGPVEDAGAEVESWMLP